MIDFRRRGNHVGCLGVHFAITDETVARFLGADGDDDAVMELLEALEEGEMSGDPRFFQDTDKAWDAIHRCLSDGTLRSDGGAFPLNRCVLGGRWLYGRDDYIIVLITPGETKAVAGAIAPIDQAWMRRRYDALAAGEYAAYVSDQDFEYTWHWFSRLKEFFVRAAEGGFSVLFTASQ